MGKNYDAAVTKFTTSGNTSSLQEICKQKMILKNVDKILIYKDIKAEIF